MGGAGQYQTGLNTSRLDRAWDGQPKLDADQEPQGEEANGALHHDSVVQVRGMRLNGYLLRWKEQDRRST